MAMHSYKVFTDNIKEMTKTCIRTLKTMMVKCGGIWFLWRNMVLCSMIQSFTCTLEHITETPFRSLESVQSLVKSKTQIWCLLSPQRTSYVGLQLLCNRTCLRRVDVNCQCVILLCLWVAYPVICSDIL